MNHQNKRIIKSKSMVYKKITCKMNHEREKSESNKKCSHEQMNRERIHESNRKVYEQNESRVNK